MPKCPICQSNLSRKIDQKIQDNCDRLELIAWCSDRGLKLSNKTINDHVNNHLKDDIKTIERTVDVRVELTDFDGYIASLGMSVDDFKNLDSNIENVIYGAQKALSLLFFKNSAIASKKLDLALMDEAAYPTEEIKGLKGVYEMFSRVTGIQHRIDENTAIKALESRGYIISKGFVDIESQVKD